MSLQQASCPEQQHFRLVITSRVTEFDLAHSFLSELQLRPRSSQLLYRQAAMLASSPPPPSSFLSTSHLAYLPIFFFNPNPFHLFSFPSLSFPSLSLLFFIFLITSSHFLSSLMFPSLSSPFFIYLISSCHVISFPFLYLSFLS